MVSKPLYAMSNIADFCVNFIFNSMVLYVVPSNILTIASLNISSINVTFTLINFCSFGFHTMHYFGKIGKDLFKKLKQQYHEFITPSSLNTFLDS